MWCSFSRRSRSVQPLHKAARPETRDCVSRCSVALHTASHRLAERNRSVALRSLFMSGLDAPFSPCLRSDCPSPARLSRANGKTSLHNYQYSARAGKTGISRPAFVRPAPAAAYGLATYAICGRKQHRPSDERPLQRRCGHQRHHPPEGCCWGYIYLFFGRSRACARKLSYVIY